jgi:spermidine synthase
MGATLPLLAGFAARRLPTAGSRAGRLYAANTAGAVFGAAAAGLVLLPALGVARTNGLAVLLDLLVGAAAIGLGRRAVTPAIPVHAGPAPPRRPGSRGRPGASPGFALHAALLTAAVSGAVGLVYEVAWTRALTLVLGSSVYAFTVMLTTVLLGLAAGSFLAARVVDRLRAPGLALGLVQLLTGAAGAATLWGLGELPFLFLALFRSSGGRHDLVLLVELLVAAAVVLLPALGAGAVFPLCVRLAIAGEPVVGRAVGHLAGLNALGAIAGSVLGSFLLLPRTGIRGTLLFAILVNLACALVLLVLLGGRRRAVVLPLALAAPALGLGLIVAAPPWQPRLMTAGVAVYARDLQGLSRREVLEARRRARLRFYEEGLTATVSVEERDGVLSLHLDGKADASTAAVDMATQVLLGHLPVLFHPEPADVLVVGLGSGVTAGSALRHPLRAVTVVELEDAVVRASRLFDAVSGAPLDDPRARLVRSDARHFLRLTRERFDVIVSEPSNPWMSVAAGLFTREFFEAARARLAPGGVMGQWLHLYALEPELLRTVVATFHTVFPTRGLRSASDVLLIGAGARSGPTGEAVARRMAVPPVRDDLARVRVSGLPDLLPRLLLDVEDVPLFARGAALNTDDNARLEFAAPRSLYADTTAENLRGLTRARQGGGAVATRLGGPRP